jgi:hypothetical protein
MKTACSFNLTLCVLQMFVGITAILGGIGLVSDPSGAMKTRNSWIELNQ